MFYDRKDAGEKLGQALKAYKGTNAIVLGIPRGGAITAYYVAKALNANFNLLIVRKLPLPENPESGFGAIAEDGTVYLHEDAKAWVTDDEMKRIIKEQKEVIKERQKLRTKPLTSLKGKTVILVDDGIAMGSTMIAGIKACRNNGAKRVIAASPVAGKETADKVAVYADELIILETPEEFYAVAQAYYEWHDCTDDEVKKVLNE